MWTEGGGERWKGVFGDGEGDDGKGSDDEAWTWTRKGRTREKNGERVMVRSECACAARSVPSLEGCLPLLLPLAEVGRRLHKPIINRFSSGTARIESTQSTKRQGDRSIV